MSEALTRAVAEQGYTEPTPIQTQAIPVVLSGRDLIGTAQTGTGKTAGFTLPLLQRLAASPPAEKRRPVRALILAPTRELAAQVHESVRTYGRNLHLRTAVIFGGVGAGPQVEALRRGVDILVATPGRLLDHVEQDVLDLGQVEILVLDEADRMLDMGFIPAIRRVLALLPRKRQNLLFSATFPDEIRTLAASFMHDPQTIEVAARNTPAELVAQVAHPVDAARKRELLAYLIKSNDWRQVLVFSRTKHGANRLAEQLAREGIEADAIHGNKSQNARTRALGSFKRNELRVLVATDIAARGLDIDSLPHVVNYDLPHVPEDYVHRIGRTGRAGSEGEAVSLVSAEDRPLFAAIERLMGRSVELREVPGFEPGISGPSDTRPHGDRQPRPGRPGGQRRSADRNRQGRNRQRGQPRGNVQPRADAPPRGDAQPRGDFQPRDPQRVQHRAPERSSLPGQERSWSPSQNRSPRPGQGRRNTNRSPGSGANAAGRRGPGRGGPARSGQGRAGHGAQQGRGGPRFRPEQFADEERKLQLMEHRRRAREGGPEFAPPPQPSAEPEPKVKPPVQVTTKPRRFFAALLGRDKEPSE